MSTHNPPARRWFFGGWYALLLLLRFEKKTSTAPPGPASTPPPAAWLPGDCVVYSSGNIESYTYSYPEPCPSRRAVQAQVKNSTYNGR